MLLRFVEEVVGWTVLEVKFLLFCFKLCSFDVYILVFLFFLEKGFLRTCIYLVSIIDYSYGFFFSG